MVLAVVDQEVAAESFSASVGSDVVGADVVVVAVAAEEMVCS